MNIGQKHKCHINTLLHKICHNGLNEIKAVVTYTIGYNQKTWARHSDHFANDTRQIGCVEYGHALPKDTLKNSNPIVCWWWIQSLLTLMIYFLTGLRARVYFSKFEVLNKNCQIVKLSDLGCMEAFRKRQKSRGEKKKMGCNFKDFWNQISQFFFFFFYIFKPV